jgi:hypothetical protein
MSNGEITIVTPRGRVRLTLKQLRILSIEIEGEMNLPATREALHQAVAGDLVEVPEAEREALSGRIDELLTRYSPAEQTSLNGLVILASALRRR